MHALRPKQKTQRRRNQAKQTKQRNSPSFLPLLAPLPLPKLSHVALPRPPIQLASGGNHFLILSNGIVFGMGSNFFGELGVDPSILTDVERPRRIPAPPIAAIAAGQSHSLLLTNNAEVLAFGSNHRGQLGFRLPAPQRFTWEPTVIETLLGLPIAAIQAGNHHSLFLSENHDVLSCGSNWSGQLGLGEEEEETSVFLPTLIETEESTVVAVSGGKNHSLFLNSVGQVLVAGQVQMYEDEIERFPFLELIIFYEELPYEDLLGPRIVQIAAGGEHSLALSSQGVVHVFGGNEHGQLGLSLATPSHPPTRLTFGSPVIAIWAGQNHSLLLTEDRRLFSFGANGDGQLGVGDHENRMSPTFVMDNVMTASAGGTHSLVATLDGVVWGCGTLDETELGVVPTEIMRA